MTPFETASGMLVYLVGCVIQGAIGFGANLFAVPILALVNPGFVPGPVLMINPVLNAMLTYRERGHVNGEALGWSLTGRLPGIVVGVVALNLVSKDNLAFSSGCSCSAQSRSRHVGCTPVETGARCSPPVRPAASWGPRSAWADRPWPWC